MKVADPPDLLHRLLTSVGGVPCAQIWADTFLWELVLNDQPQLKAIVELGTWSGGFSRYLAAQAGWRGLSFRTYDSVPPEHEPPGFVRADIFRDAKLITSYLLGEEPLCLLVDNGNKPRELATFPKHLRPGSIVIVHDWLPDRRRGIVDATWVGPEHVPDCLEPLYEELCDELGSLSRVFSVRRTSGAEQE